MMVIRTTNPATPSHSDVAAPVHPLRTKAGIETAPHAAKSLIGASEA